MKKVLGVLLMVGAVLAGSSAGMAQKAGFGFLYYDGDVVRTVVPPAAMAKEGRDNFYVVMPTAAMGQLGIAAVAPGDKGYHGGKWAFHEVMFQVAPYLLTSEADVLAAEQAGDVTVTRIPGMDFKCPIQP